MTATGQGPRRATGEQGGARGDLRSGGAKSKRSIRNIVQERSTQFGLGMTLASVAVFNAAFFGIMVWFLIDELIGRVAGINSDLAHAEEALRAGQFETLLWAVSLSIIYGVLLFGLGVALAHRIAGPLNRVLEELTRLAAGDAPARIRLRDSDLLRPYAEEVNMQLEQIAMGRAHATVRLRAIVEGSPDPEALRAQLQEVIVMLHPAAVSASAASADDASGEE